MIHKVKISNFKSINELELELGRVNVFVGENGCGKTNILEAIALGNIGLENAIYFGDNTTENLREFIKRLDFTPNAVAMIPENIAHIKGVRITRADLMLSAFKTTKEFTQLSFFDKENKENKVSCAYLEQGLHYFFLKKEFTPHRIILATNSLVNEPPVEYKSKKEKPSILNRTNFLMYCPENHFLRRFEEEGQIKPLGTKGEGLFKHLVELQRNQSEIIKKINKKLRLIDWFGKFEIPNDLMFTERRLNIKDKYLEGLEYFDQRSANEGFLHLLFYFTLFMSPYTPSFFAIDNIDTALNPKLAAKLIKELTIIAKENNKQVLLTTHNPGLLDGLDLKDDAQRLFSIYRDIDGETSAHRITPLKPVNGREPVRLSEAFVRGYIGALPQNF